MCSGFIRNCLVLLVAVASADATAATPKLSQTPTAEQVIAQSTGEGMTAIRVEGLEILHVNPQARLDGYTHVLLKPVEVVPWRDWRIRAHEAGVRLNLRPMIERARTVARESVKRHLVDGGYALADTPGTGVAEVKASIIDIFLIALDTGHDPVRTESFSLGTATLLVEVRDSATGELILRAFDVDRGPAPVLPPMRAGEEAEAWLATTIDGWAQRLRAGLDISNRKRNAGS